jgi:hypothetical protein
MMSTTKNLRLARVVKTLIDVLYGLTIFTGVGLIIWLAIAPIVLNGSQGWGTASVPVTIGVGEEPQFDVDFTSSAEDEINAAYVVEAEGTLQLQTRSFLLILITNAAKILGLVGLGYFLYLLRGVVKSILEGEPFAEENAGRIRKLGYVLLVVSILWPFIQYLAASEILRRLPEIDPAMKPGPTFDAGVVLISLLILLLAHVWSYGLEIERDRELTI